MLCYVGRLTKDKGIDILFEAFNQLSKRHSNLKLLVAGPLIPENPFSSRFMQQLNNDPSVIFAGKVSDIIPLYAITDILILPSYREGLPNVLIEAAAMETPVIASNIPGCRDVIKPGFNGELFEKGNVNDLVNHTEKLINDPALRKSYGNNGRIVAASDFDNKKIWVGQLSMYEKMMAL